MSATTHQTALPATPLTQRLGDSAVVQRLDLAALHTKGMAILAKLQEDDGVTLKPSHICSFYENVVNKNPASSAGGRSLVPPRTGGSPI